MADRRNDFVAPVALHFLLPNPATSMLRLKAEDLKATAIVGPRRDKAFFIKTWD